MLKKVIMQKVAVDISEEEGKEEERDRIRADFVFPSAEADQIAVVSRIFFASLDTVKIPVAFDFEIKLSSENAERADELARQQKPAAQGLYRRLVSVSERVPTLSKLLKESGVYALSSVITPLIALALAPFLTHSLSTTDYGILTLLTTIVGLITGITQLGLGSALFRAYSYDYNEICDKRAVIATTTMLLLLVSVPVVLGIVMVAPFFANLLLGNSSLGKLIIVTAGTILVENLTIPGFSWLRAENRALLYSLLSIGNMLLTLLSTIFFVGIVHWGIVGALLSIATGQLAVGICTIPYIIVRAGMKIRMDIAKNLLSFGIPLVFSFMASWVLQLSDRYFLSHFSSIAETAKYSIAYTLGSALSVVVLGPFSLAWPSSMFSIAKRKDAAHVFQLVFRWFSLFLLLAAFGLSCTGVFLLNLLFPVAYHSMALVIPIISISIVFSGTYYILIVGASIERKTWVHSLCTILAAVMNLLFNIILIPYYGAMGAALATLFAFILMAAAAYKFNQKLYPIPFEIGHFTIALLIGVVLYAACYSLTKVQGLYVTYAINIAAMAVYGACLIVIAKFPRPASIHSK